MRVRILSFVLLSFLLCSNFVWAVTWVEVTRFTGSGDYVTDYFTCNHTEWRIVWNYTAMSNYTEYTRFIVDALTRNDTSLVATISQEGNTTTNGTTYVHNLQGKFYLNIYMANVESYTVVIEQDIDSVPEFSPIFLLALSVMGILVAMILGKKVRTSLPA